MIALLCTLNARYVHSSLALHSLKAQVRDMEGPVTFRVREFTINMSPMELLAGIIGEQPDRLFLGLYIWNREETLRLVRDLHRIRPDLPVYLGGPEATHDAGGLLRDHPEIAGIFIGEAETSFRNFWKERLILPDGENDPVVPGLMVRNRTFRPQEPLDPGTLAFAYPPETLKDLEHRILYYESSRGCPFCCAYCLSSVDRVLRFKPLDQVEREIRMLAGAGVRQVKFVDRTFNADPQRALALWTLIGDLPEDTVTNFHFEVTGDRLSDEALKVLTALPPGRVQLEIGVQSCTPEVLEVCGRRTDIGAIERNVRVLKSAGNIHLHLDLIAGLPGETPESFARSFDRVWAMGADQLQLGFLKVLRGSPMETLAPDYGIRSSASAPYEVLETGTMDFDTLNGLRRGAQALDSLANSGLMPATLGRFASRWPGGALALFLVLGRETGRRSSVREKFRQVQTLLNECFDPEDVRSHLLFDWLLAHRHNTLPEFLASATQQGFWLDAVRSGRAMRALGDRVTDAGGPDSPDSRRIYKDMGAVVFDRLVYYNGVPLQTRVDDPVVFDYRRTQPSGLPGVFCVDRGHWDRDPEDEKGCDGT